MARKLPDYAKRLQLQHRALAAEYRRMLQAVSESMADLTDQKTFSPVRIADVACGDGAFTRQLATLFPGATVVGLDSNPEFLELARKQRVSDDHSNIDHLNVSYDLYDVDQPLPEQYAEQFDLVFCSDSFQSISDHEKFVSRLRDMLREHGVLLITETDGLHDVIVSVPPAIELAMRRMELDQMRDAAKRGYVFPMVASECLRKMLFEPVRLRSMTIDRTAPWTDEVRDWIDQHLRDRVEAIRDRESDDGYADVVRHLHPDGQCYVGRDANAVLTYLRYFVWGTASSKNDILPESTS